MLQIDLPKSRDDFSFANQKPVRRYDVDTSFAPLASTYVEVNGLQPVALHLQCM